MSNNRDNSPELDYYELRRRHEEYKSRARTVQPSGRAEAAEAPARTAPRTQPKAPAAQEAPRRTEAPSAEIPAPEPSADLQAAPSEDPLAQFIDENEGFDDDAGLVEEAGGDENPNPFDSFIRFFHGVKNNLAARRATRQAELEDMDALSDEELAALEADEFESEDPGDFVPPAGRPEPARAAAEAGAEDIETGALDIETDVLPQKRRAARRTEAVEAVDDDFDPDEDGEGFDEVFDGGEDAPRGGFRRFMNLFVTRVDESDEDIAQDAEPEDEFPVEPRASRRSRKSARVEDDDAFYDEFIRNVHRKSEGGQNMDEMNKPVSETNQQMAEGLETSGMSRRERRERAMRLAAEEAARKAEEDARLAAASAPIPEPLFSDAPAVEPIAEPVAAEAPAVLEEVVEEPTREFTPVSMRNAHEPAAKGLFDVEDAPEADEDGDEDPDDDDAYVGEKPRRGLFGRKRAAKYEDDDDDDDDDDYDEYDDEDDDDEYDDYDDDMPRSFGHHVVGVFKWVAGIIVFLLICVLAVNALYAAGYETIVPKAHEMMGDSTAFRALFFSYDAKRHLSDDVPEATVEPTVEPTALPQPESTVAIPNLDNNGTITETPVIDAAPVIDEAPVEPAAGAVG